MCPGRKRTNYFCLQGKRGTNEKALLLSHRYSSILGLELKTNINIRLKKPHNTQMSVSTDNASLQPCVPHVVLSDNFQ